MKSADHAFSMRTAISDIWWKCHDFAIHTQAKKNYLEKGLDVIQELWLKYSILDREMHGEEVLYVFDDRFSLRIILDLARTTCTRFQFCTQIKGISFARFGKDLPAGFWMDRAMWTKPYVRIKVPRTYKANYLGSPISDNKKSSQRKKEFNPHTPFPKIKEAIDKS